MPTRIGEATAPSLRLAVIVLAAGAGSRFSDEPGAKLVAELGGTLLLGHVLRTVRAFGPVVTVVVVGHGASSVLPLVDPEHEMVVTNPDPDRGIASTLRIGVGAVKAHPTHPDGAFVVLGDQPLLAVGTLRALAEAAAAELAAGRRPSFIVPRYVEAPGPRNPVLVLRSAFPVIEGLEGDEGLARIIEAQPEAVTTVPVPGRNPDVDTLADLGALGSADPGQGRGAADEPEAGAVPDELIREHHQERGDQHSLDRDAP